MVEEAPLLIQLDPEGGEPLHLQLYRGLREAILSGRLTPGSRIPASRVLAEELDISRTTVLTAVRRLMVEGFLEARVGAGTWVSERIREDLLGGHLSLPEEGTPVQDPLSRRGRELAGILTATPAPGRRPRAFQVGVPAIDAFPWAGWARLVRKHLRHSGHAELSYGPNVGFEPLRRAIAEYVRIARGVSCDAGQVMVTSGSQVGLTLLGHICLDPGDRGWVEDPGYPGALGAFVASGADAVPVPVDDEGLQVERGEERAPDARLAYVTPSHQFPLGVTMTLPRRLALLEWAHRAGAWVIEDDYDAEYRYAGRPLMSLQGLDGGGRAVYVGTFSKTLFPSLRLGFLVLPSELVDAAANARSFLDQHPPTVLQAALADFIEQGRFARHIRRMRELYRGRREALVEALDRRLAGALVPVPSRTGLHLTVRLAEPLDDRTVAAEARREGLEVLPLSACAQEPISHGLVLGFGSTSEDEIEEGVARLATAVDRARSEGKVA